MKARLITQGQIQYGGLSLVCCTFAPMILALTREYHSTAFLIIRKGEPIRSLRFKEILMPNRRLCVAVSGAKTIRLRNKRQDKLINVP